MNRHLDAEWAQKRAQELYGLYKRWQDVASAMRPYLDLSSGSWWQVAHGQYITPAKIKALRAQAQCLPMRKEYWRPCLSVDPRVALVQLEKLIEQVKQQIEEESHGDR